jgi:hypothetical protein
MKSKELHIAIIDSDTRFRVKLEEMLRSLEMETPEYNFTIMKAGLPEEIKIIFDSMPVELAFIDPAFFDGNGKKKLDEIFRKLQMRCQVVLLVPEMISDHIYEIMEEVDQYEHVYLEGHILKENYTPDLVRVLAKVFVKKAIS